MTQIQALENMSQPDLVNLIKFERQQHADDMDMLSKELASRAAPIELRVVPDILAEGNGCWVTCSGCHESNEGYPTGPYSQIMKCTLGVGCRECGGIGAIWDTTDYDEMADAMYGAIQEYAPPSLEAQPGALTILDENTVAERASLPPLNEDMIAILGRPNFMCAGIAQALRDGGQEIKNRAENEQAAALHFLLGHYLSDPQNWNWKAAIALNPDKTTCTCPSGNGSLRWPCPVHPPATDNLMKLSNQQVDSRIIIQSLSMAIKLIAKAAKSDGLQLASRTHHKINDALSLLERYELLGSPLRTSEE